MNNLTLKRECQQIVLPEQVRRAIVDGSPKIVVPFNKRYPTEDHSLVEVRPDNYAVFQTHKPLVHRFQYLLPLLPDTSYRLNEEWQVFRVGNDKKDVFFLKYGEHYAPRIRWMPAKIMPEDLTRTRMRTGQVDALRLFELLGIEASGDAHASVQTEWDETHPDRPLRTNPWVAVAEIKRGGR